MSALAPITSAPVPTVISKMLSAHMRRSEIIGLETLSNLTPVLDCLEDFIPHPYRRR